MKNEIPLMIDLNTFTALDVQEEGLLTRNGDEPWLVVVPIIADGRTVDYANLAGSGARMYRATKSHENLGHLGVDDGDTFAIPASVGEFHTTLQPWRNLPTTEGKKAATVGLVVVALEEDLSSDAVADTVSSLVALAIKGEVDNLVKAGAAPTESGLAQWRADIADAVTDVAFDQSYENLDLPGLADPDDIIGVGFQAVTQAELEAAGSGGRAVDLTLIGDGAGYNVSGVVRRG